MPASSLGSGLLPRGMVLTSLDGNGQVTLHARSALEDEPRKAHRLLRFLVSVIDRVGQR